MNGPFAFVAVVVLSILAAFPQHVLADGDPVNGKILFISNCSSCHKLGAVDSARSAANDPAAIRNAFSVIPPMNQPSLKALTDSQLADIAAYIGTVVSGTVGAANYQGLWWAAGGTEPFWGINFVHQGDQVFATWYTYSTSGKAWWLSMLATKTTGSTYSGPIYVDSGPPFNAFVGAGVPVQVGTGTVTFSDVNNGSFSYTVTTTTPATMQMKSIARFDLGTGPQPTCTYSATPTLAAATNYQDLWWVVGGTESGWGINFAHQGDSVFATWYTYDVDGTPLWLSVLAPRVGTSNVYTGTLYRTSGPRFDAYDPAKAVAQQVGTATISVTDGNNAMLSYSTTGLGGLPIVTQSKSLTRFLFAAPAGTVCK